MTVLHLATADVRVMFAKNTNAAYRQQRLRLRMLWENLRWLNSMLPLHVLVSGDGAKSKVMNSSELLPLWMNGVVAHTYPAPQVPPWASLQV